MSTLILFSTKHGTARKCAEKLKEKLLGKVDVFNIKTDSIPELKQYDKVIIGGSIYAGRIQKEVFDYCLNNLEALKNKKLGLFIACMNQKEANKQTNNAFPEELLKNAYVKDSFGGEFKFKEMNFFERFIVKIVSKALAKENPSLNIDLKKDLSLISEERICSFAEKMNND